jgi:hypothetical protein
MGMIPSVSTPFFSLPIPLKGFSGSHWTQSICMVIMTPWLKLYAGTNATSAVQIHPLTPLSFENKLYWNSQSAIPTKIPSFKNTNIFSTKPSDNTH